MSKSTKASAKAAEQEQEVTPAQKQPESQTPPDYATGDADQPAQVESAEQNTADDVNNPDATNEETAEVIAEQMQTRGPSMMEMTMAAASAAGTPAVDAMAAADGIVVTRQDLEASSDSPVTAESTQAHEESGDSKE